MKSSTQVLVDANDGQALSARTTYTGVKAIHFSSLPTLGSALEGGTFAGLTTSKSGQHHAVVLLPDHATDLTWKKAMNWAKKLDAELPSRPIAAMLFHNLKDKLQPGWHWTNKEDDASSAWGCTFDDGNQSYVRKSYEGSAVAVRCIPLTA
jgi:hypothetical protein